MLNPSNRRIENRRSQRMGFRCKDNYYFEALQIGDLLLRREYAIQILILKD